MRTLIRYIYLVGPPEFPNWKRWGFPKKDDIGEEIKSVESMLSKLKEEVEGKVELVGGNVVSSEKDCIKLSEFLSEADGLLVFYLIHGPLKCLWAHKIPLTIFLKYGENVWDGHLRTQLAWEDWKKMGQAQGVDIIIDNFDKLVESVKRMNTIKRIKESKLVSIGPPESMFGSWGAMRKVKELFGNEVVLMDYDTVVKRYGEMEETEDVENTVKEFFEGAEKPVSLSKQNVVKATRLYMVLKNILQEKGAEAITLNCYEGAIEALGDTSPCLALSKLNDEGYIGACESDFPAMLTMIVLKNIAEKPTFLADVAVSSLEKNEILLAHCSSPTKMRGFDLEREHYFLKTQYESDEKAAIQVKMEKGKTVTVATFSHDFGKMLITKGEITRSTEFPICRTQVGVKVSDAGEFMKRFQGFHWVLVYGDLVEKLKQICSFFGIEVEEI